MASISKIVGRLLAVGLFIFLIAQIIIALGKLRDEKTAVSTTTQYEQSRLMPSFSICFHIKRPAYQGNDPSELAQITLNQTRKVKFKQNLLKINFYCLRYSSRLQILEKFQHNHDQQYEG